MKVLSIALLSLTAVSGFAPSGFGVRTRTTTLAADSETAADTSSFIQSAFEATEKYGASSPEAQLAWEAVEEINVRNEQSDAYTGLSVDDCNVEEEPTPECLDYGEKMEELSKLLKVHGPMLTRVKSIAEDMQAIKITAPESSPGSDSPEHRAALEHAQEMTKQFGVQSPEAKLAWAELEEIASASNSNAMGARLDEECLTETIEACKALEELHRVLNLNKNVDRYSG